jgi:MOSC domain-containing protein YiiM
MPQCRVVAIFVSPRCGEPMQSVESVETVAAKGIIGDRKFRDGAGGQKDQPDREITLIEAEAIDAVNRDYELRLDPIETRRNLLTCGVALNHLVDREFSVGPVRLRGLRLCEPCAHLESLTRKGVMRALLHRGGLRAQIIHGGPIRAGDAITVEAALP